jgi:hypothetical protein
MAAVKGTAQERAQIRAANRQQRQTQHAIGLATSARTGHDKVVAATQAAKAASRRMRDEGSREMAVEIALVVERFDVEANWEAKR